MKIFRYSMNSPEWYRNAREVEGWERWKTHTAEWNLVWLLFGGQASFDELLPEIRESLVETAKEDMERNGHWLRALMQLPAQEAADYLSDHPKRWKAVRTLRYCEEESLRARFINVDWFCEAHPLDLEEDPLCLSYMPEEVDEVERIANELLDRAAGTKQ